MIEDMPPRRKKDGTLDMRTREAKKLKAQGKVNDCGEYTRGGGRSCGRDTSPSYCYVPDDGADRIRRLKAEEHARFN